jgi:hypothetical protein
MIIYLQFNILMKISMSLKDCLILQTLIVLTNTNYGKCKR